MYKVWIYSKKKMFAQLLCTSLNEYFNQKINDENILIDIEQIKELEKIKETIEKQKCILVFDVCREEETENLKDILLEIRNISEKLEYLILLNDFYYPLDEQLKMVKCDEINDEIEKLKNKIETYISGENTEKEQNTGERTLTKREKEILILIARGLLNKEIANELNITERTVKNHISNLFKKINVYDRTQAAVYAIKNKIYGI